VTQSTALQPMSDSQHGKSETQIRNRASRYRICIRFAIGCTVPRVWVFPGRHFADCDRNGELWLVNGAFGAVTDLCVISLIFLSSVHDVCTIFGMLIQNEISDELNK